MTRLRLSLPGLLVLLMLPLPGLAQWQWIDGSGRRVYSDQAPPPEIAPDKILGRPGSRASPAPLSAAADSAAAAASPSAAKPVISGRDKELEDRRKQAEAAEAGKRKAEQERVSKVRADNCSRARQAKATLDSGIRLARVNDKGEREILDDAARAAEGKRLDAVIASDCDAP